MRRAKSVRAGADDRRGSRIARSEVPCPRPIVETGVGSLRRAACLVAFGLVAAVAPQAATAQESGRLAPVLDELRPLDAPDGILSAADVRWRSDGSLLVGLRRDGIHSWVLGGIRTELLVTLAGTTYRRAGRYGNYSRLGGESASGLVFAGDLFGVYRQRDGRITALKANLEIVGDLDHRDGWTVAVGLARQPEPSPGPDDIWEPYVAWLFDGEGGVRGLTPTRDGGAALDSCYPVELTIGRFVTDDLILVIPGAEPGAFLYGADGMLRQAADLGAFSASRADCGPEQKPLLPEEEFRTAWLRRHRVIDEVAANGQGDMFFFVRHVEDGEAAARAHTERGPVIAARAVDAEQTAARYRAAVAAGDVTATAGRNVGAAGGEPGRFVFGLDDLAASDVKTLVEEDVKTLLEEDVKTLLEEEAASQDGTVVLTGERAAALLAAVKVKSDVGGVPASPVAERPSPLRGSVCWDIVHARVDDLRSVSTAPCAVKSDLADARLRVDLAGDRAVLLIRGATRLASGNAPRPAEFFEARLRAGS